MSKIPNAGKYTRSREGNTPTRSYPVQNTPNRQYSEPNNYNTPREVPASNSPNAIVYGIIILILAVGFWAIFLNPDTASKPRTETTPSITPNTADNPNKPTEFYLQSYGDGEIALLKKGETRGYFFSGTGSGNPKSVVIKIDSDLRNQGLDLSLTDYDFIVGYEYVPSFESKHYDYISRTGGGDKGYTIYNPAKEKGSSNIYHVIVRNLGNEEGTYKITTTYNY